MCYVFAYLDRVNISFAKLQMQQEMGISEAVYGLAAGIFFLGYVLFEIPSNLLLMRIGARKTISRILVLWGITSVCMIFVRDASSFYVLRFLLGLFEAGFGPGMLFYLTLWYSTSRLAGVTAIVLVAAPVASLVGGPLSGWIMATMHQVAGLADWQWLFLLQGIPAVLLGLVVLCVLTDSPDRAKWLSADERQRVQEIVAADVQRAQPNPEDRGRPPWGYLCLLGLAMAATNLGIYAGVFWLPTMLKSAGIGDLKIVGLFSALPYLGSIAVMLGVGASSDKFHERRLHVTFTMFMGALALAISALWPGRTAVAWAGVIASISFLIGITPLIWTVLSQNVAGKAAAISFAVLNIFGALGGFFGPYLMGLAQTLTASVTAALLFASGLCVIGGLIVLITTSKSVPNTGRS